VLYNIRNIHSKNGRRKTTVKVLRKAGGRGWLRIKDMPGKWGKWCSFSAFPAGKGASAEFMCALEK